MGSGNPSASEENGVPETSGSSVVGHHVKKRKTRGKIIPLRIHKSEREKIKREHINNLFLHLAAALELSPPNNGKAAIVDEANRVLREAFLQAECLKTENAALLSESEYVSVEVSELRGETLALETYVENLRKEIKAHPYWEIPYPKFGDPFYAGVGSGSEHGAPQQVVPVYVIPVAPAYVDPSTVVKPAANLSKPHARYPSEMDLWPSDVLGDQSNYR